MFVVGISSILIKSFSKNSFFKFLITGFAKFKYCDWDMIILIEGKMRNAAAK